MMLGKESAKMIAIINATLYPISGPIIPKGTILIEGSKIKAVGSDIAIPVGAEIIDAAGKHIMPGIVEAHCHLSIMDFGDDDDNQALDSAPAPMNPGFGPAVTPEMMAYYAFNPFHNDLYRSLTAGVTTILTRTGSGKILTGQGIVAKTHGKSRKEMVLRNPAELKAALGENPKRSFGSRRLMPSTRLGSAALFRDAFIKGQAYLEKRAQNPLMPYNQQLEPIAMALRHEIPVCIHAHRADDIMTALRMKDEFGFNCTIEHASEAHLIAEELRKRNVPAVLGPTQARTKLETAGKDFVAAGILERAGVTVCITTDAGVVPIEHLRTSVSLSYRAGMSEAGALKAMTLTAAEVIHVADRLGSLDAGKDADLAIFDGHPLELLSRVEQTYVNGILAYDHLRDPEPWQKR